jgi:predicted  nucleic acid-binding Zn-ribbon protein
MNKNGYKFIKQQPFQNESCLKIFKFFWKGLVVIILSVLIIIPAPALALVNTEKVQSYAVSSSSDVRYILSSIEELGKFQSQSNHPRIILSWKLRSIENSIDKVGDDAAKYAEEFQIRSSELQKELSQNLDKINEIYQEQQKLNLDIENLNSELSGLSSLQASTKSELDKSRERYDKMKKESEARRTVIALSSINNNPYNNNIISNSFNAKRFSSLGKEIKEEEEQLSILEIQIRDIKNKIREKDLELSQKREKIKVLKDTQEKLESEDKSLAAGVVLAKNIFLSGNILKQQTVKVKQRIQDVRDSYEFNSVEELRDLKKSVFDLEDIINQSLKSIEREISKNISS